VYNIKHLLFLFEYQMDFTPVPHTGDTEIKSWPGYHISWQVFLSLSTISLPQHSHPLSVTERYNLIDKNVTWTWLLSWQLCLVGNWLTDWAVSQGWHSMRAYSRSFWTGHLEWELQIVQLSATRCSCITILWVSLVSFASITLCVVFKVHDINIQGSHVHHVLNRVNINRKVHHCCIHHNSNFKYIALGTSVHWTHYILRYGRHHIEWEYNLQNECVHPVLKIFIPSAKLLVSAFSLTTWQTVKQFVLGKWHRAAGADPANSSDMSS
jgi:hypothetical protein